MTLRVAFLTPSLQRGGAEAIALQQSQLLSEDPENFCCVTYAAYAVGPLLSDARRSSAVVRVLSMTDRDARLVRARRASDGVGNATVVASACPQFDLRPAARVARDLLLALRLAAFLARDDVDVLYAHQTSMAFLAALAGALRRTPVVLAVHSADHGTQSRLTRRLLAWSVERTAATIGVSTASLQQLPAMRSWPHLHVIPNGVAMPPASPKSREDRTFSLGCAGNLTDIKRHELAIRAMPSILAGVPRSRLIIAGDGPLRGRLEKLVRDLELSDAVEFRGSYHGSTDPAYLRFLQTIDVLVVPSKTEACPLVVLEAMASAVPVVGFRTGGMPDLVVDGTTGHLVAPDDVEGLAKAVVSILQDDGLWSRMGSESLSRYERQFTTKSMRERVSRVLSTAALGTR